MKRRLIIIFFLFVVSSFLIFFKFNLIPQNISFDEIEFSRLAISLNNSNYIPYSNLATGHSTLYFYIILLSFKIFGISNFALRFPSALFGILSIFTFYKLLKNIFNEDKKIFYSILGALILLTSRWFLNFARFSFEGTFLLFLELMSIFFFLLFFKNRERRHPFRATTLFIVISGIFAGLSFLSYTPGRIFFLVPLFLLFLKKSSFKNYFFYIISFLVVAFPLLFYLIVNNDIRFNEISILTQNSSFSTKISLISENVQKTALMFNIKGDKNGRHNFPGKPALNPILGILFVLGVILSARKIKEFPNKLFLFYFLVSLLPTLLTLPHDNPNMNRTFTVLPAVIYFVIYSIKFLSTINFRINKQLLIMFFTGIILISSIIELRTYFFYQSRVFRNSFEVKCNIHEILSSTSKIIPKKCLVSKNEF